MFEIILLYFMDKYFIYLYASDVTVYDIVYLFLKDTPIS